LSKKKNRWRALVDRFESERGSGSRTDHVLFQLNLGLRLEALKRAADDAPARDQPLVRMTMALHDGDPAAIARRTREPELCLRALAYLKERGDILAAVAILVRRLDVQPDRGRLHVLVCEACDVWNAKAADASLRYVAQKDRARLARLADAMLGKNPRWDLGFAAVTNVGDEDSLPLIAALGEQKVAQWLRLGYEPPPARQTEWAIAARRIRRRGP
jgi:hypothetical protein